MFTTPLLRAARQSTATFVRKPRRCVQPRLILPKCQQLQKEIDQQVKEMEKLTKQTDERL
ncbi:hypothetical protein F53441_13688, partial [Fusarium austroafricanum]